MELTELNKIREDLYKSKIFANFKYYESGCLYYTVLLFGQDLYQFPVPIVEVLCDEELSPCVMQLSADIGETAFQCSIKGSELIRYISKAIDNEHFVLLESMTRIFQKEEENDTARN